MMLYVLLMSNREKKNNNFQACLVLILDMMNWENVAYACFTCKTNQSKFWISLFTSFVFEAAIAATQNCIYIYIYQWTWLFNNTYFFLFVIWDFIMESKGKVK